MKNLITIIIAFKLVEGNELAESLAHRTQYLAAFLQALCFEFKCNQVNFPLHLFQTQQDKYHLNIGVNVIDLASPLRRLLALCQNLRLLSLCLENK